MAWGRQRRAPDVERTADMVQARLEAVVDRLNGVLGQLEAAKSEWIAMDYAPGRERGQRGDDE